MPHHALITGFEPFGTHKVNPSERLALTLDGKRISGVTISGRILPVVYAGLGQRIASLLDELQPDLVIALGLAPGESDIRLERFAVNLADAELPDNAGAEPSDAPVVPGGPVAFAATLPLRQIARAIAQEGIKVRLSNSAGTYLCNAALYHLLATLAQQGRTIPCGFIHLPDLPDQVKRGAPAMEFARMERALGLAIEACDGDMPSSDRTA